MELSKTFFSSLLRVVITCTSRWIRVNRRWNMGIKRFLIHVRNDLNLLNIHIWIRYSDSIVFEAWTLTYRESTVNLILQTLQTVYLVQHERFRTSSVSTVPDRFWTFNDRFMTVSKLFKRSQTVENGRIHSWNVHANGQEL